MVKLAFLKLAGRVAQGLLLVMVPATLGLAVAESVIRPKPSCFLVSKIRPGVVVPGCEDVGAAVGALQNQESLLDARIAAAQGQPHAPVVQAATEAAQQAEQRQWRERRDRTAITTESVVSSAWLVSATRAIAVVAGVLALVALVVSLIPVEGLPRALVALGSLMILGAGVWLTADRALSPALRCYVSPDVLRTMEARTTCEVEAGELDRRWRKLYRDLPIVEAEVQRLEAQFATAVADQAAEAAVRRERASIGEPEELRMLRERAGAMRSSQNQLVDEIWYRSIPYDALAWGTLSYGVILVLTGLGIGAWRQRRDKPAAA